MAISLGELAVQFGCELVGDPDAEVSRVATLANAVAGDLSFFANKAYRNELATTAATAVIISPTEVDSCSTNALLAEDPYLAYAGIASVIHPYDEITSGIHESSVVSAAAQVAATAQVSANAVVEGNAIIGESVFIGAGVVVGPGCRIGAHTRVLANATLVREVKIGERCIVHPGAVIGADGFGNAMSDAGWRKVPQLGGVSIGNDVEIGANTTIDSGAIDDTVIEDGVRLDNLIQIAHNVRIGAHTAMAALSGVSGSTTIGQRCMFAGQSGIVGHITICDDVVIGGATMVSKNISEPGFYAASFPAEKDREWKRLVARFRQLDQMHKRLMKLEKRGGDNGR